MSNIIIYTMELQYLMRQNELRNINAFTVFIPGRSPHSENPFSTQSRSFVPPRKLISTEDGFEKCQLDGDTGVSSPPPVHQGSCRSLSDPVMKPNHSLPAKYLILISCIDFINQENGCGCSFQISREGD